MSTLSSEGIANVSRRSVLKGGAALTIAIAVARGEVLQADSAAATPGFAPNDFIRVSKDGVVTIISKHLEMGQGIYTGLATLIAEELDASWSQLRIETAPADASRFANVFMRLQGTGGSTSIANSFDQYRKAGAAARAMLVSAAAKKWSLPESEITVREGKVSHSASGMSTGFGELVADASKLPVP